MASMEDKKNAKKRSSKSKSKTLTLEKVKALGHDLLSSREHINNLPILISSLSLPSPLDVILETLITLQSFFIPLLPEIPSKDLDISSGKEEDAELVYRIWLRKRFDEFVSLLVGIVVVPEAEVALKDVVLDTLMEFVKSGKDGKFQSAIYHRFLQTIVNRPSSVDRLLETLAENYFEYLDIRYFTYTSLDKIAKDCDIGHIAGTKEVDMQSGKDFSCTEMAVRHIHNILSRIPRLESLENGSSHKMWSQSGLSSDEADRALSELSKDSKSHKSKSLSSTNILKKIKLRFTKAWLSFLKLPLPLDIYKEVLVSLPPNVFPYMANPAVLCDFLTRSYDIGGVISVMALSGLFVLLTQHGLEYPKFYEKLYALLTPSVFMAKHRAVFFQLLDTCLKSAHLPAYLAAAFAKKLSRLSLSVPPPGELVIIALIHNLLRRHPSINFLVHKQSDEDNAQDASMEDDNTMQSRKSGIDPFKIEEEDPSSSGAMLSSLWEIDSLRNHYCPAISRFVASLENDLTVRAKTSEVAIADFASGSYATIFRDEMRRRIKQVPLAFYKVTPNSLFSESESPGWCFGNTQNNSTEASKADEEDKDRLTKKQKI